MTLKLSVLIILGSGLMFSCRSNENTPQTSTPVAATSPSLPAGSGGKIECTQEGSQGWTMLIELHLLESFPPQSRISMKHPNVTVASPLVEFVTESVAYSNPPLYFYKSKLGETGSLNLQTRDKKTGTGTFKLSADAQEQHVVCSFKLAN